MTPEDRVIMMVDLIEAMECKCNVPGGFERADDETVTYINIVSEDDICNRSKKLNELKGD